MPIMLSRLRLRNSKQQNEDVFKNYVNVYIHCEGNLTVEAHMVVLAQHSPFCHKYFQSRQGMQVADLFFVTLKHSVVNKAIKIIYGKSVDIEEPEFKRICSFLRILQVDFETAPLAETNIQNVALERTFESQRPSTTTSPLPQANPIHLVDKAHDVVDLDRTFDSQSPDVQANSELNAMEMETDNWTVTTESHNRVLEIDHTAEASKTEKKMKYICKHCREICFAFHKAETHFFRIHLDMKPMHELMAKVERHHTSFCKEYEDLVEAYAHNGNKILVQHELE